MSGISNNWDTGNRCSESYCAIQIIGFPKYFQVPIQHCFLGEELSIGQGEPYSHYNFHIMNLPLRYCQFNKLKQSIRMILVQKTYGPNRRSIFFMSVGQLVNYLVMAR